MATLSNKEIAQELDNASERPIKSNKRSRRPGKTERRRAAVREEQIQPTNIQEEQMNQDNQPAVDHAAPIEEVPAQEASTIVQVEVEKPVDAAPVEPAPEVEAPAAKPEASPAQEEPKVEEEQPAQKQKPVVHDSASVFGQFKPDTLMGVLKNIPSIFTGASSEVHFDGSSLLNDKAHISIRHGAILGAFMAIRALLPNATSLKTGSDVTLVIEDAVTRAKISFTISQTGKVVEGVRALSVSWDGVCSAQSMQEHVVKSVNGTIDGLTVDKFVEILGQVAGIHTALNKATGK